MELLKIENLCKIYGSGKNQVTDRRKGVSGRTGCICAE